MNSGGSRSCSAPWSGIGRTTTRPSARDRESARGHEQGFSGPRAREAIVERFAALPLLVPDRDDHIAAADLRNHCRQRGVQVGTIDALLATLCIRHELTMLTADDDFRHIARHTDLRVSGP